MNEAYESKEYRIEPELYEIRVRGHLDSRWAGWFGDLAIKLEEGGSTLLTGLVVDQAALYGLLGKVRDLGLTLISLYIVQSGRENTSADKR